MATSPEMKQLFDHLPQWPDPKGSTSDAHKTHHSWLKAIVGHIQLLDQRVKALEIDNAAKQRTIDEQATTISNMSTTNTVKPNRGWEKATIMADLRQELKQVKTKENNIIISGLSEHNFKDQIDAVLDAVGVGDANIARKEKLRTKTKTSLVVVEFSDINAKLKAVKNARLLRTNTRFNSIYLNSDKTQSERIAEKLVRDEVKRLNANLPNKDDDNKPYDTEKDEKFRWVAGSTKPRKLFYERSYD